jgi:hypothetical protein
MKCRGEGCRTEKRHTRETNHIFRNIYNTHATEFIKTTFSLRDFYVYICIFFILLLLLVVVVVVVVV